MVVELLRVGGGPIWLGTSFALMYLRVEPFATYFYLFAWGGLIFSLDMLIRQVDGSSLIRRCGSGLPLLLLWSTTCWFFFELLNLRLQNWYYVFVTDRDLLRLVGTFVSFATVFPGIFWIDHLLAARGVAALLTGAPLRLTRSRLVWLQSLGLVLLVLPLLLPRYFFPLVWVGPILLIAPTNYRRGGDSLLRQLERGSYGPAVRMLLAGLLAGLFWEFFNFWARAKWIYTVPFFEELKLFEMPVAGFLGFPPFALECAVLYRFLVWHRLAPAFGAFADQKPVPTPTALKGVAIVLALLFSTGVYRFVDRWTITSVTPRVDRIAALDLETRAALAAQGIEHLSDLRGIGAASRWRRLQADLDDDRWRHLRQMTELYLHQGIGIRYGNLLARAGITSVADLRGLKADEVLELLRPLESPLNLSAKQVRVWIRRAGDGARGS